MLDQACNSKIDKATETPAHATAGVSEHAMMKNVDKIEVSIIVVSYNTQKLTLECLRSVYKEMTSTAFELIVVDNASSDGSADAVASQFPDVHLISLEENIGFARANNLAAEHAQGDYLLLLNPDTVVLNSAVDKLCAFAKSYGESGIFGGRTLFADGSLNIASCWGRPTVWSVLCRSLGLATLFKNTRLFNPEVLPGWSRDTVREVQIVSGCFLLISRSLWDRLGGFAPSFFMYGEDADLCLRAQELGARCIICPEAEIIHYLGASEKEPAGKMIRLFQGKAKLFARHWGRFAFHLGVWLFDLHALRQMLTYACLSLFSKRGVDGCREWITIWRNRKEWQKVLGECSADHREEERQQIENSSRRIYYTRGMVIRIVYLLIAITSFVAHRIGRRRQDRVVVLCYHAVTRSQRDRFNAQMATIANNGSASGEACSRTSRSPHVMVTFDDAFKCVIQNAVPSLQAHNIPYLVFVVTGCLGRAPEWLSTAIHTEAAISLMGVDDLRQLAEDPLCRFGSHTVNHSDLAAIPKEQLVKELMDSKLSLENLLGVAIEDLALPYGSYNEEVMSLCVASGYKRVYTLNPCLVSSQDSKVEIGRFSMSPDVWGIEFWLTCEGAYSWLRPWRRLLRCIRARTSYLTGRC